MEHPTTAALEAGTDHIRCSPADVGTVELIVCRSDRGAREELDEAVLDCVEGLVGDNWRARGAGAPPTARRIPGGRSR